MGWRVGCGVKGLGYREGACRGCVLFNYFLWGGGVVLGPSLVAEQFVQIARLSVRRLQQTLGFLDVCLFVLGY